MVSWLDGDGTSDASATFGSGDEFDAGPASHLLAEDIGHRVGERGYEPCRDLVAVGAGQGRLADAERECWRGVIAG